MAGIVLGVAVFVGMQAADETVLRGFSQTADRIAGKTQLQVTAGDAGFGEDVLENVQSASMVAAAAPVIEAVATPALPGAGSLLIVGVDMTGDRNLRDYQLESSDDAVVDDPLVFLAQPDSVILAKGFATQQHLSVGDRLPLLTVEGKKALTVRGIMTPAGMATAFGGNLAIMDIYAAQKMFGRGRTFDRIDVGVKDGHTIESCQRELSALLGPGFQVEPPSSRRHQFETMLAAYSMTVSLSSLFALFIGMFIIYNSFSIAVTQRRFEIGLLRAIGATRWEIRRLFLAESALLGAAGSAIGLLAGMLIARLIAAWLGAFVTDLFRVAESVDQVTVPAWLLTVAFGIGVATSMIAAAIPSDRAARVDPVHAFKRAEQDVVTPEHTRLRVTIAAGAACAAVICLVFPGPRLMFYVGYLLGIAAAVLVAPTLSISLVRACRPLLQRLWPVEGTLAADSLMRAPKRTSSAIAALMLSLALVVAFGGIGRANYDSIVNWTNTALNPDLFVLPTQSLDNLSARFPATMAPEIAAVAGVARVQPLRNTRVMVHGIPTMLLSFDMTSMAQTIAVRPVAGSADEMYRKAAAGEGAQISDNLAQLRGLVLGDLVEIAAPYGVLRLPIVGIVVDYSDQQGSILIDRSLYQKYWHDDSVNMFRVYVKPGTTISTVRQSILDYYDGKRQVFVLTNDELKGYIFRVVSQWFGLTSGQIAVAVLVAILGIVNVLTVSVIDRQRELGVLQAVGARRQQLRRTIWIEAIVVAVIGIVLGYMFGALNLLYMLDVVRRDIAGLRLDYAFPFGTALAVAPAILIAAFVAALGPGETAVRGSLIAALEYE
jgi:putative ABC transport system permease protein